MKNVKIHTITVGALQTQCYILSNIETKECVVFDPGAQAQKIINEIEEQGLTLKSILFTHGHFDHILAAEEIAVKKQVPIYASRREENLLKDDRMNLSIMLGTPVKGKADKYFDDLDILEIAGIRMQVILTPGHTSGSVCFYIKDENLLISGDTLFFESVGRTDFPTGNSQEIIDSLRSRVFILPDEVMVCPGHGDKTSIGHEKKNNPFV